MQALQPFWKLTGSGCGRQIKLMKECNDRTFVLSLLTCLLSLISAQAATKIFWTETRGDAAFIVSANADGSGVTDILSGASAIKGPNGLEYGNNLLFWPDQQLNMVSKANSDGSGATAVTSASNPYDVFVGSDRIYWSSQTGNYINSAKPDGSDVITVHGRRTVNSPFAVEVTASAIYWSEVSGSGRIQKSDLDGGNIVTVLNNAYIYDMQISGDIIYFGDNNFPAAIKRVNLDGTGLKTLLLVDFCNGIWLTRDSIYWSDLFSGIHHAGLDGSNPQSFYTPSPGNQVRGVVVLEDAAPAATQPTLGNPQRLGNNFTFTVQGKAGSTIKIEKTSAPGTTWNQISSFVAGNDVETVTNEIGKGVKSEIFRAKSE